MPFADCQKCGRLFHRFDPTLPEAPDGYWPNLGLGDAVHEFCPECLKTEREQQHDSDRSENAARGSGIDNSTL
jgi:hypothetical protein